MKYKKLFKYLRYIKNSFKLIQLFTISVVGRIIRNIRIFYNKYLPRILYVIIWVSIFIFLISYIYYKYSIALISIIVLVICFIFSLFRDQISDNDIKIFRELIIELKNFPNEFKKLIKLALIAFLCSLLLIIIHWIFTQWEGNPKFNFIIFNNLLMRAYKTWFFIFSITLIIFFIKRYISFRKSYKLIDGFIGGLALICLYFLTYISKNYSPFFLFLTISLGYFGCYCRIKKLNFNNSKTNINNRIIKLFLLLQLSALITVISTNFLLLGLLPGSEKHMEQCYTRLSFALDNIVKTSDIFKSQYKEYLKGFENADFINITYSYYNDKNLVKALQYFKEIESITSTTNNLTWHKYNIFNYYNGLSKDFIYSSRLFYFEVPLLFNSTQQNISALKIANEILSNQDLDPMQINNKLNNSLIRKALLDVLEHSFICNNLFLKLKPRWLFREFHLFRGIGDFFTNIEMRIYILLNYKKIKEEYNDRIILFYRQSILDDFPKQYGYYAVRPEWGNVYIVNFDRDIVYLTDDRKIKKILGDIPNIYKN